MQADRGCPGCGTQWQCPVYKAEAVEEGGDADEPTESQPPPRYTRKRLRSDKTIVADSNGSGPSQISVRTTRSSARLGK